MKLLLDVRDPDEYAAGHIPGAISLPILAILYGNLGILTDTPKDTPIELYCHSGGRSARAFELLTEQGFSQVVNLGGMADAEKQVAAALTEESQGLAKE